MATRDHWRIGARGRWDRSRPAGVHGRASARRRGSRGSAGVGWRRLRAEYHCLARVSQRANQPAALRRWVCRGLAFTRTDPRLYLRIAEVSGPCSRWPCAAPGVLRSHERTSRPHGSRAARRDSRHSGRAPVVADLLLDSRLAALSRAPRRPRRRGSSSARASASAGDRGRGLRRRRRIGLRALGPRRRSPHRTADISLTSGMTASEKRSISSNCGLNCSSNKSTPACSKARMRSAICSGVPVSPAFSPRLDTE